MKCFLLFTLSLLSPVATGAVHVDTLDVKNDSFRIVETVKPSLCEPGRFNGVAVVNQHVLESIQSKASKAGAFLPRVLPGGGQRGSNIQVPTTVITKTTVRHVDGYARRGPVQGLVALVAMNSNPQAHFVHGETSIPIKEGNLILFEGNVEHNTIVDAGYVSYLGPFDVEGFNSVSIRGCFSRKDTVLVEGKGMVKMDELQLGDMVQIGPGDGDDDGAFDRLYAFAHRQEDTEMTFLQIYLEGLEEDDKNQQPLELTTGHLLYVAHNKNPITASMLRIGDHLLLANGGTAPIKDIQKVERRGVYTPLTMSGRLAVNGIVASSYVSFQPDSDVLLEIGDDSFEMPVYSDVLKIGSFKTPITWHWGSHAFQAPHRILCRLFPGTGLCTSESMCEKGYLFPTVALAVRLHWLFKEENAIFLILASPALLILFLLKWIEDAFLLNWKGVLFVLATAMMYYRRALRGKKKSKTLKAE